MKKQLKNYKQQNLEQQQKRLAKKENAVNHFWILRTDEKYKRCERISNFGKNFANNSETVKKFGKVADLKPHKTRKNETANRISYTGTEKSESSDSKLLGPC